MKKGRMKGTWKKWRGGGKEGRKEERNKVKDE